jgi:hypothetical protein
MADNIQDAIRRSGGGDSRPTIERGSYGDRSVLEEGRTDGVGKPGDNQPNLPSQQPVIVSATVVVDHGSKLSGHAVEITEFLTQTAHYNGHGSLYPAATGSKIPTEAPDNDYAKSGIRQQDEPDKDND